MNAVANAVSNAIPANRAGTDIPVPEDQLPKDMRKHAVEMIDKAWDIQFGKGGIEETARKLEELRGSIADCVYAICKDAVKQAGNDLRMARNIFLGLCAVAEKHLTNKAKADNDDRPMGQLIPSWPVYKSQIAKGLGAGIDPNAKAEIGGAPEYPTGNAYIAKVKTESGGATGSQAGTDRQQQNQTSNTVQELVSRGFTTNLSTAMGILVSKLQKLNIGNQDRFAAKLINLAKEADEMLAKQQEEDKEREEQARQTSLKEDKLRDERNAAARAAEAKTDHGKRNPGKRAA
jgi:hypothetical protein